MLGHRHFFLLLEGETHIARPLRVNDQIRIRTVRVIDDEGKQLGVIPTEEAQNLARSKGLDLIEVSPTAVPPVCRIADYGRLKYEQSKKDKDARKKQTNRELKEVKLRPKIETHDYETKARMAERLLIDGGKVKVTIMFRGREITYTAFGRRLLDRMATDMTPIAAVEREPKLEGRNMFMILAPRAVPTGPPKFTSQAHPEHNADPQEPAHPAHDEDEQDEPTLENVETSQDEHPSQDTEAERDAEADRDAPLEQSGEHATGVVTSA
ncbi:MAG: translation initiation factor IF-3 [Candidatus Baltobacteraceae bacterium]